MVHNRVLISENHTGIRNLYLAKVRVTGQVVRSCQTSHTDGYGAFQGRDVLNGTVQVGFGDPQVLELYWPENTEFFIAALLIGRPSSKYLGAEGM